MIKELTKAGDYFVNLRKNRKNYRMILELQD